MRDSLAFHDEEISALEGKRKIKRILTYGRKGLFWNTSGVGSVPSSAVFQLEATVHPTICSINAAIAQDSQIKNQPTEMAAIRTVAMAWFETTSPMTNSIMQNATI